jgi:hypothetical protein
LAILRPSSDLITGGWSSTDALLSTAIDETTASDSDYISSSAAGQIARVSLGTYTTSGGTHEVHYRAASPEADRGLIVRLLELGQPPAIVTSKQPWRSQPQVPVGIDLNNPITLGLVLAEAPHTSRLLASTGVGEFVYNNTNKILSANAKISESEFTVHILFKTSTVSGVQVVVSRGPNNAGTNNTGFGFNSSHSSPEYSGAFYVGQSYTIIGKPTGNALSSSTDYNIALVYNGTQGYGYHNGIKTIGPTSGSTLDSTARFCMNQDSANNAISDNKIYLVTYWNRALSDSEIESISDNPWQIFKPQTRISYFDVPKVLGTQTKTAEELGTTGYNGTISVTESITNGAELALEVESI